jgi:hypothetical protein
MRATQHVVPLLLCHANELAYAKRGCSPRHASPAIGHWRGPVARRHPGRHGRACPDTGRPRVDSQLLLHGSFDGRAEARLTTRRTRAIKSRARRRLPLRRIERTVAGASCGRFVAVPRRPEGQRPGRRFGCHPHVRIAHIRGSVPAEDGVTEPDFRTRDEQKAGSASM